jgi:hypothetical protein
MTEVNITNIEPYPFSILNMNNFDTDIGHSKYGRNYYEIEFIEQDIRPEHNMVFHNRKNEMVGKFNFDTDVLTFTGNTDESAEILCNFLIETFNSKIDKMMDEKVAEERSRILKILDESTDLVGLKDKI